MRGAWIEIVLLCAENVAVWSLPVRGAWIEIFPASSFLRADSSRSPCGERGLKSVCLRVRAQTEDASLPVRGAWIEMVQQTRKVRIVIVAPRAGSVD